MEENEKRCIISVWKTLSILKIFFGSFKSLRASDVEIMLTYPDKKWNKLKAAQITEILSRLNDDGYLEITARRAYSRRGSGQSLVYYKITKAGRLRYTELTNIFGPLMKK